MDRIARHALFKLVLLVVLTILIGLYLIYGF